MTRVPSVGARVPIWRGCMRTSVVELIGMLEKTALGKRPILGRALLAMLGDVLDAEPRIIALTLPNDAMNVSVAIRQQGEAN